MANHTYDGQAVAATGAMGEATNWDAIPDAVAGVLIFDAVQNAPNGYADGVAPAIPMAGAPLIFNSAMAEATSR